LSRDPHENRVTTGGENHVARLKKYRGRFIAWIALLILVPLAIQVVLFTLPTALKAPVFQLHMNGAPLADGSVGPVLMLMLDQTLKGAVFDFFEVWGWNIAAIDVQQQSFAVKAVIATYRLVVIKIVIDLLIITAVLTFDLWFKKNAAGIGGWGEEKPSRPIFSAIPFEASTPISTSPDEAPDEQLGERLRR